MQFPKVVFDVDKASNAASVIWLYALVGSD